MPRLGNYTTVVLYHEPFVASVQGRLIWFVNEHRVLDKAEQSYDPGAKKYTGGDI